jgi:hypothetical protein
MHWSRRVAWLTFLITACAAPGACNPVQQGEGKHKVRPLAAAEVPKDLGARAHAHVAKVVAMGPRCAGEAGWKQQLDYIGAELQKAGLKLERDAWTDSKEGIAFENVSATIAGASKDRILLTCHHDTKRTTGHDDKSHNFPFVGANDGGSAVGLLLALAPILAKRQNAATIELVFFDGEESLDWDWNDAKRALFGSKRYVKQHRDAEVLGHEPRIAAMVLLDMVGRTDLHIQDEEYSTPALREIAWSAIVACGQQQSFYRRSAYAGDDHKPFLDAGIPALDLIDLDGNPHWHKQTDTLDNVSAASLQKVGQVLLTMLPEIEREYLPRSGGAPKGH